MRTGFVRLLALVARRDYTRTVRRRGFIFGTLLLPLGLGLLLGLSAIFSTNAQSPGAQSAGPLVIVNESSLALKVDPRLAPNIQLVTHPEALQQLDSGEAKEFYLVPSTYPTDPTVLRIEASSKGLGLDSLQRQSLQEQELDVLLRSALLTDAQVPPATSIRVIVPSKVTAQTPEGQPVSEAGIAAGFLVPYAFTLLFVMSIFITSGYLLQSVTEEKENRVVEIVLSSVPPLPLMAGKILGLGAAGLTQVIIWLGTALLAIPLLNERLSIDITVAPSTLVLGIVYFVLGYLAYGAIFSAIGALAPGSREAQQYSGFLGFFAVIPLIVASVFLTDINSPIVWVLAIFPLTAPATMLQVLTLSPTLPVAMVIASLVSLVIFVVIATAASARVFRATLLLYGVRPSMRQIMGAMLARG